MAVTPAQPVFHFVPDRTITYSADWDLKSANRVRINRAGFASLHEYAADERRPVVALVGDSYIEGLIVPQPQTMGSRLSEIAAPDLAVYAFAASGAPLSQYVAWAEHAKKRYGARGAVFLVVGNDFDESLASVKQGPGFHHFVEEGDELRLKLFPYHPNPRRKLVFGSALGRYLVFNLKVLSLPSRLDRYWQDRATTEVTNEAAPVFVGNTVARADPPRIASSERAVDAFLRELKTRTGWRPDRVMFVLDGMRDYTETGLTHDDSSYFARMRTYLAGAAQRAGHQVVDMHPIFSEHFSVHRQRFEHPHDGHWNGLAHGLAAKAVAESGFLTPRYWQQP
ncbi:MAG: hypothetical protein AAF458_05810 [Pseudomonadota bacterium]